MAIASSLESRLDVTNAAVRFVLEELPRAAVKTTPTAEDIVRVEDDVSESDYDYDSDTGSVSDESDSSSNSDDEAINSGSSDDNDGEEMEDQGNFILILNHLFIFFLL